MALRRFQSTIIVGYPPTRASLTPPIMIRLRVLGSLALSRDDGTEIVSTM
jgi:hypothetical protein